MKPFGRSLSDFGTLKPAEEMLREACRVGEYCVLGEKRPEQATDDNTVRASFVRFLTLGGDEHAPVHEQGVQLVGAWIDEQLDLIGATVVGDLALVYCWFDVAPNLHGVHIRGSLFLEGSRVPGLTADGLVCEGGVFLRNNFFSEGEVRLLGANIGAHLDCCGAKLDGGTLSADGMQVKGGFFFRDLKTPVNGVSLNHAKVGQLVDDEGSWGELLVLDGFEYGSLAGNNTPKDANHRLRWLDKQSPVFSGADGNGDNFCPQPWQQLQKVLREMGHLEDARQVAMAFERRLRKAGLVGQTSAPEWHPSYWLAGPLKRLLHWLFGLMVGYGYRPLNLASWMLAVSLLCAAFYWVAALQGVFSPSDPLVFQSQVYKACVPGSKEAKAELEKPASAHPVQGAGNWYLCETLPEEYTGFSPLAYSLDVILPLVDLQQEHDWSPLIPTPSSSWGIELIAFDLKHFTRLVIWFEILFGWIASLLLVAVVSGLTKRRED